METIKTLQERLEARADEKLRDYVAKAFKPALDLMYECNNTSGAAGVYYGDKYSAAVLGEIRASTIESLTPVFREREIVAFVNEVDRLSAEVEELRESVA